jgi:hypothetical protein
MIRQIAVETRLVRAVRGMDDQSHERTSPHLRHYYSQAAAGEKRTWGWLRLASHHLPAAAAQAFEPLLFIALDAPHGRDHPAPLPTGPAIGRHKVAPGRGGRA